jgi:hypothetical protein
VDPDGSGPLGPITVPSAPALPGVTPTATPPPN